MADTKDQNDKKAALIEWIVAGFSAAIVLALAGFILFEAVTKTGSEPDIGFTVQSGIAMSGGYVVEVRVSNSGHVTVADLEIEASVDLGDGERQVSAATLDYLAAESSSEIGFGFSQQVDPEQVSLRVVGYGYP